MTIQYIKSYKVQTTHLQIIVLLQHTFKKLHKHLKKSKTHKSTLESKMKNDLRL